MHVTAPFIQTLGLVAGVILPLWNIPLIVRIQRRRSSQDISLPWALGVFGCLVLMFPSALLSSDVVFKTFSIINITLFTAVVVQVVRFRHG
mgnify:CR=1 FL=1